MTKNSLIIDLRRQLPWHKRYVSHTTTAMLWAGWIFLWRPLMIVAGFIGVQNPYLFNHFIEVFTRALENGFTALVACAISLWLWSNFASAKKVKPLQQNSVEDYAHYFALNPEDLTQSRQQKIMTVHHNVEGKITNIV